MQGKSRGGEEEREPTIPCNPRNELQLLIIRGTILNRTYGTHKNLYIYIAIFTNNIWSYLLWSPVIRGREERRAKIMNKKKKKE